MNSSVINITQVLKVTLLDRWLVVEKDYIEREKSIFKFTL